MDVGAVADSFKFYFYRGRIPFSLIHKPLKLRCLNEMVTQILTDWVRTCDAAALWDEKINNPVIFVIPNGAGIIPNQYEIPQINVPAGNIRVITSFLREDRDIDAIIASTTNFFDSHENERRSPLAPHLEKLCPDPIIENNSITLAPMYSPKLVEEYSFKTKTIEKIRDKIGIKISTYEFQGISPIENTFSTEKPTKIFSGNPFKAARDLIKFLNEEYNKTKNENN